MKASKVNHTKTAVGIRKNEIAAKGFIYDNPNVRGNENLTTEHRLRILNKNAKILYNILNPQITYTDDEDIIKICGQIRYSMGYMINYLMKIHANNPDEKVQQQIEKLKCLKTDSIIGTRKDRKLNTYTDLKLNNLYVSFNVNESHHYTKETVIDDLVENCLKKSLRKTVNIGSEQISIREVVKKFIQAVTAPKNFEKICKRITDKEWAAFFQIVNEDYEKKNQIRKIAKSIEHQNVKVQPVHEADGIVLKLSSAVKDEPTRNNGLKKYIFQFLEDYTKRGEDGQKRMVIHMRQLILLYCTASCREDGTPDIEMNKKLLGYAVSEKRFENLPSDVYFCNEAHDIYEKRGLIGKELENPEQELNSEQKRGKKHLKNEIQEKIKKQITVNYTVSKKCITEQGFFEDGEKPDPDMDLFWINYISETVEKLLVKKGKWKFLSVMPLCKAIFEEWTSYIAKKYIDMGKAVYHFAMPDLFNIEKQENAHIGNVREPFAGGLTSFDYERIKADETLERDQIVSIIFAAQNFSRCICSSEQMTGNNDEDILLYKENKIKEIFKEKCEKEEAQLNATQDLEIQDITEKAKKEAIRPLMQFWGGLSKWEDQIRDIMGETYENIDKFANTVKNEIYLLRNSCYHYTSFIAEDAEGAPLIKKMFEVEYGRIGQIIFEKYYSNNVFVFYDISEIRELAGYLYTGSGSIPAQIPCFNRIVGMNNIDEFIVKCIGTERWGKELEDTDIRKIYRTCFLFLLKEIYYHDFLHQAGIKEAFIKVIKQKKEKNQDKKEKAAASNLYGRLNGLKGNPSFGEVCQVIMTDYNMQNQGNMKVKIKTEGGPDKENLYDEEIYQHFRMLLYAGIQEVFSNYLKEQVISGRFCCLKNPEVREQTAKEEAFQKFTGNKPWNPGLFSDIYREVDSNRRNPELLAWYTTAHFINPKQLNLLIGSFKNYIQFMNDIHKREITAGIKNKKGLNNEKTEKYNKIIRILEFTKLFNGRTTNCWTDYFKDEEEYARHVSCYVHLDHPTKAGLQAFCDQNINPDKPNDRFGIYYDAANPIVNRNIVFASMYGMEQILKECVEPVEEKEIRELYKLKESLQPVFKDGKCKNKKEQEKLRSFTNQKNRIELTNIMTYSEMLSDLAGQLVSWAYLRERDLMYFQRGYYYIKLFCGKKDSRDDWMRTLKGDGIDICDGAILYQIVAMYTYVLPVYTIKEGSAVIASQEGSAGKGVNMFYAEYCQKDESVYNAGLFFFEIVDEHDFIIAFRNEMDHFKYFANPKRSILEYYAMIYDRFFDYDLKLKKSMIFILKNILARYFVAVDLFMGSEPGVVEHKNIGSRKKPVYRFRKCTSLTIGEKGLLSALLDYKKNGKIQARDEKFLKEVRNILEYKNNK